MKAKKQGDIRINKDIVPNASYLINNDNGTNISVNIL